MIIAFAKLLMGTKGARLNKSTNNFNAVETLDDGEVDCTTSNPSGTKLE